jgi:hypothetical protein
MTSDEKLTILFTLQDAIKRLQWVEEQLCEDDEGEGEVEQDKV